MKIAVNCLYKVRNQCIRKWVSVNSIDCHKPQSGPIRYLWKNTRLYSSENWHTSDKSLLDKPQKTTTKISHRAVVKGAQAALLEYLHVTRSVPFLDAENMSINSPHFLEKLLQKVDNGRDVGQSVARFLRYHPINEFEPFFESLGLEPCEFTPLLPRDLMFLSDDDVLLENYYVLCNYGVPRNKMGRIYKEAAEVFRYKHGLLALKLQGYEQLGLSQSFISKVVACSPYLLIGNVNVEFVKVMEILRKGGIEFSWIEERLWENRFNWSQMLALLGLFNKEGFSELQLADLISQNPGILFEGSGDTTLCLIGFLFKFGSSMQNICSMFVRFPLMQVGKFVYNLRRCFLLLTEIGMDVNEIGNIVRSHPILLGSFTLKKTNSLLAHLNVGKRRLCKLIQENPEEMKKWKMGLKVERLPNSSEESKNLKAKFLLDMGFVDDNPNKMEEALKVFRGRGTEIQERFDCLVKAGLDKKDVFEMIKISPQILNQKKEVLEKKINFYANDLGFPLSYLVNFPSYLNYTIQRVKLRVTMYSWLKEQGSSELALSTLIACTENMFVRKYVKHHPRGVEVWDDLKNKIH
ncbi:transcription termination factor MTEF18, mitochondrial-like [Mercurialis annua]|uniref:transcription termination factor MTEF18, mitochondrial-like n=1 Tax=Mercurialis annua TaxID=3986 RepID=UPI0021602EBC|nr:transcription termination factor MTEF18, mitochondrial-like [Mercurialis annua]